MRRLIANENPYGPGPAARAAATDAVANGWRYALREVGALQAAVADLWKDINTDTLRELSDFAGYKREFLQLFGFEVDGVDYDADVNPDVPIAQLV